MLSNNHQYPKSTTSSAQEILDRIRAHNEVTQKPNKSHNHLSNDLPVRSRLKSSQTTIQGARGGGANCHLKQTKCAAFEEEPVKNYSATMTISTSSGITEPTPIPTPQFMEKITTVPKDLPCHTIQPHVKTYVEPECQVVTEKKQPHTPRPCEMIEKIVSVSEDVPCHTNGNQMQQKQQPLDYFTPQHTHDPSERNTDCCTKDVCCKPLGFTCQTHDTKMHDKCSDNLPPVITYPIIDKKTGIVPMCKKCITRSIACDDCYEKKPTCCKENIANECKKKVIPGQACMYCVFNQDPYTTEILGYNKKKTRVDNTQSAYIPSEDDTSNCHGSGGGECGRKESSYYITPLDSADQLPHHVLLMDPPGTTHRESYLEGGDQSTEDEPIAGRQNDLPELVLSDSESSQEEGEDGYSTLIGGRRGGRGRNRSRSRSRSRWGGGGGGRKVFGRRRRYGPGVFRPLQTVRKILNPLLPKRRVKIIKPHRLGSRRGPIRGYNADLPYYIDPRKKNQFQNKHLWWYRGQNLHTRHPYNNTYGAGLGLGLSLDISLPKVIGRVWSPHDYYPRCHAVDKTYGIRCPNAADLRCNICSSNHYCSELHRAYHDTVKGWWCFTYPDHKYRPDLVLYR